MMKFRHLLVTVSLLPLIVPAAVLADGTSENALVIIDPTNADSLMMGNYYKNARDIPDANVLYMTPLPTDYAKFVETRVPALTGSLYLKRIEDHVDFIVLMPGSPFYLSAQGYVSDGCAAVHRFSASSCYTMAFLSDDILAGVSSSFGNRYYSQDNSVIAFSSETRWLGGLPSTSDLARRYYIGHLLGYSGERGNTLDEIKAMVDRSVAVDGTHPDGTFYFMETTDVARSGPRDGSYPGIVADIIAEGGNAEHLFGVLPDGRHDILGIMTGWATPAIDTTDMTILPGAFCDHLTSYAGKFDTDSQTKMSRWIANGAAGSYGAVEEPCNYGGKFPRSRIHLYYFKGLTMGEALFRSLNYTPFQGLSIGDPLTRPFTYIPSVDVLDAPGTPVSGTITLTPTATTGHPTAGIDGYDLLVDGIVIDSISFGETFSLDTTILADGYHDLRVLAYDDTAVRAAGRWVGSFETDNFGLSAGASAGVTTGDLATPFAVDVSAAGGVVDEIQLIQNGRVVAATAQPADTLTVFGRTLGAGEVTVVARALFADGHEAVSVPLALSIADDPGTPTGPAPIAYGYTKTVYDNLPFLVELPAAFDDDPSGVSYTLLTTPSQADVTQNFAGPFSLMTPIEGATGTDQFTYRVTAPSGQADATITLVYTEGPMLDCPPDINGDTVVNSLDFIDFLLLFNAGNPGADFNGDGTVNSVDFIAFLNAFVAGC